MSLQTNCVSEPLLKFSDEAPDMGTIPNQARSFGAPTSNGTQSMVSLNVHTEPAVLPNSDG